MRLRSRLPPVIATMSPSRYSLRVAAFRSRARYSSAVSVSLRSDDMAPLYHEEFRDGFCRPLASTSSDEAEASRKRPMLATAEFQEIRGVDIVDHGIVIM